MKSFIKTLIDQRGNIRFDLSYGWIIKKKKIGNSFQIEMLKRRFLYFSHQIIILRHKTCLGLDWISSLHC